MKPTINFYQSLIALDNPKHRQRNMLSSEHALWHKIRIASSGSPFVDFDMAEFIVSHFSYDKWEFNENELKEIVTESVRYFNKGSEEEIYNLITKKLRK